MDPAKCGTRHCFGTEVDDAIEISLMTEIWRAGGLADL
jgi:hypothetical protein